jgi:PII-like signaling protein
MRSDSKVPKEATPGDLLFDWIVQALFDLTLDGVKVARHLNGSGRDSHIQLINGVDDLLDIPVGVFLGEPPEGVKDIRPERFTDPAVVKAVRTLTSLDVQHETVVERDELNDVIKSTERKLLSGLA